MADSASSDSVSSWPGFVDQLNKTFMLIRDAFGYALPGAVFLSIGLIYHRFSMSQVDDFLSPYNHVPAWMAFLGIVAVSYAVGGVLAAVAYSPFMILKYIFWMIERYTPKPALPAPPTTNIPTEVEASAVIDRPHQHLEVHERVRTLPGGKTSAPAVPEPPEGTRQEWLLNHPTEVCSKIVEIRSEQPKLMDTLDRRETLALLAASMTTALLGGWYVFCKANWNCAAILKCAGLFTLLQFLTGMPT